MRTSWTMTTALIVALLSLGVENAQGIRWLALSKIHSVGTVMPPEQMCDTMKGSLIKKQINFCKKNPTFMDSVREGASRAIEECQFQFRSRRWNCSTLENSFNQDMADIRASLGPVVAPAPLDRGRMPVASGDYPDLLQGAALNSAIRDHQFVMRQGRGRQQQQQQQHYWPMSQDQQQDQYRSSGLRGSNRYNSGGNNRRQTSNPGMNNYNYNSNNYNYNGNRRRAASQRDSEFRRGERLSRKARHGLNSGTDTTENEVPEPSAGPANNNNNNNSNNKNSLNDKKTARPMDANTAYDTNSSVSFTNETYLIQNLPAVPSAAPRPAEASNRPVDDEDGSVAPVQQPGGRRGDYGGDRRGNNRDRKRKGGRKNRRGGKNNRKSANDKKIDIIKEKWEKEGYGPYPVVSAGTREMAFVHAISSAGVAHALTRACSAGELENCGCDRSLRGPSEEGFEWSGCSDNVDFGITFSRSFVDARDRRKSRKKPKLAQPLMNLHNNEAGRRLLKRNMKVECKCHGVSGSCELKTCWRSLPPFREIGEILKEKFDSAHEVKQRKRRGRRMLLTRNAPYRSNKPHTDTDLVYLKASPNYCEFDITKGSLGTHGRECNRNSDGPDGCNQLCCNRGYMTRREKRKERCKCKFHWCCFVECEECLTEVEVSTCN